MSSFADDNYTIRWSKDILNAKIKLENSLSVITSWLKASGLKVKESKTKICLFSRGHMLLIEISLNGQIITTKSTINVLGIIFDAKLQWGPQVPMAITKASRALNAVRTTGEQMIEITVTK